MKDTDTMVLALNNYRYGGLVSAGLINEADVVYEGGAVRDMITEYVESLDGPLMPEVDNNWKITGGGPVPGGPPPAELVEYINLGLLEAPYDKSYNLSDYDALVAQAKANNVVVNGKASFADALEAVAAMQGGIAPTFRLRDLAYILKGTEMAFNVEWNDAAAQVVVTKGGEYSAVDMPESPEAGEIAGITVTVDARPWS